MSNVMFFCIPAHGHTNPTLGVVKALVRRGHRVRYYSFNEFREKIEVCGAEFVSCDKYLPPTPDDLDDKVGRDFASLIEMVVDTTVNMEEMIDGDIADFKPDVIVSDSVCFWGKLFAIKHAIPFVCSTTTFAFNKYSAKLMKQSLGEIIRMFTGMPRINSKIEELRSHGYAVKDFVSIIQNDNDTNTVVYTSKLFQPMSETFSEKYAFVGPSVKDTEPSDKANDVPKIYISLGTVLNDNIGFYKNCIDALNGIDCEVTISAGKKTDITKLGDLPKNFKVYPYVDQMAVLAQSDLFITHCGMNSVSESLYMGVPMVLFPQHSEEYAVAHRAEELGVGVMIKKGSVRELKRSITKLLCDNRYRKAAEKIRDNFKSCGGADMAADFIERVASENK